MKKLYRKSTVHPSPPFISDQLAFLPATILTLAAALSFEDREVLAYLLSSSCSVSSGGFSCNRRTVKAAGGDHPPSFNCSCFRCYMSYWVRWDSSPNRQLIHEIIDAFEDELAVKKSRSKGAVKNNKRERRSKKGSNNSNRSGELNRCELGLGGGELGESESVEEEEEEELSATTTGCVDGEEEEMMGGCGEEGIEKGSVRKFVNFIGERIWSVWV